MVSGEKRNCEETNALEKISVILLDIEGTTTSVSFVKDTLFPYVRENLKSYVESHWDDDDFKEDLKALKLQANKDEEDKIENFCPIKEGAEEKETLIKNILWQMDLDRKTTALKQLQGHIWRKGYENGKLKGHVYSDVPLMFKKWCEEGRKLYIYSSGSVEAQKLLFKNSESGDLSEFLSGYFDTEQGPKTEPSSFISIAKTVGCDTSQILFLTDVIKEAVAADKAGFMVMIVVREGNSPVTDEEKKAFTTITSLKDIVFESSTKKKKICEENISQEDEQTQNVEAAEEPSEVKNGEPMEIEKVDAKTEKSKTDEMEQNKAEVQILTEPLESETINVDVDNMDTNTEIEEKTMSSSHEETDNKNGSVLIDNTEDAEVAENKEVEEMTKAASPIAEKEGEIANGNKKSEMELEKEDKNGGVSLNGHKSEENKENNGEISAETVEEKIDDTNGKLKEEIEEIPIKKVTGEEQADSTVEVIA